MKRRISFQFYRDFIISRTSILLLVVLLWNMAPFTNHYNKSLPLGEDIGHIQINIKQAATVTFLSASLSTSTRENLWLSFRRAVSGWFICPPQIVMADRKKKKKSRRRGLSVSLLQFAAAREYAKESYSQPLWRSLFLLDLWLASGQSLPEFLILLLTELREALA